MASGPALNRKSNVTPILAVILLSQYFARSYYCCYYYYYYYYCYYYYCYYYYYYYLILIFLYLCFYKFELRVNKNTINIYFGLKIREMILYKQKFQIICKSKARLKGKRKYMKIPLPAPFYLHLTKFNGHCN